MQKVIDTPKNTIMFKILVIIVISSISNIALAQTERDNGNQAHRMEPNPNPYRVIYDDGTTSPFLRLRIQGEENSPLHQIYEETLDSFTVKSVEGKYVYLEVDDNTGEYIETDLVFGVDNPYSAHIHTDAAKRREKVLKRIRKETKPSNIFDRKLQGERRKDNHKHHRRTVITSGILKNLVIPIRFKDHIGRPLPSKADLNTLLNHEGTNPLCPTGSVRNVYLQNSSNKLDLQSTVIDWVTIDYTEAYCAAGESGVTQTFFTCLISALNEAVATGINFGDYDLDNDGVIDGITFFHSGFAAEFGGNDIYGTNFVNRIWSHKWKIYTTKWKSNGVQVSDYHINPALWDVSGSNIGRIGVVAHEIGHFLGLPDLYDYGTRTSAYGEGNGVGSWGIMANAWGLMVINTTLH